MECFEEQVPGADGQFLVPTDLWRFRIAIYMRRHDGTTLYQKKLSKQKAGARPALLLDGRCEKLVGDLALLVASGRHE
ncbi:hypothetical protein MTO96_000081 [Rhipicephalus appendiculatus]